MSEPLSWLPDGTPYSPRFSDRYRSSAHHGLNQARQTFVAGCGLPAAWAGQAQWRVLETGFGLGLNFLATWAVWRADPARPALLHYSACEAWPVAAADLLRAAPPDPEITALAQQLAAQWWGLLPGVHHLQFDRGRVQLTLLVGDAQALLRQQQPPADSVYLDGFAPAHNPELWSMHTLKAVARCCHRGTRAATWCVARSVRESLTQCGFEVRKVDGTPPKRANLQASYNPRWEPKTGHPPLPTVTLPAGRRALVVGAGISGACVAAQLAQRGWQVQVLDARAAAAQGASGIPAGVFSPHVSPDDSLLSRLTRAGVRATLATLQQWAGDLCGQAWLDSGVLEHGVEAPPRLAWSDGEGLEWSAPATPEQLAASGLPLDAPGCWHARGGWIAPHALVRRLLAQPGITLHTGAAVQQLQRSAHGLWQARDAQGTVLAEADLTVLCAGAGSNALLGWHLQPLRGLMSFGAWPAASAAPRPQHPINGHGNFLPTIALPDGSSGWAVGSTFERDEDRLPLTAREVEQAHGANHERLLALAPQQGAALAAAFGQAQGWTGVRCAAPNHLPVVTPLDESASLWACTAMGARGLTLAPLCAQLLAARLHGEPLPLDSRLARAMDKCPT